MAITFTSLATGTANSNNNQVSHTGNAGTPSSGDLLICFVNVSGDNQAGGTMAGTFTWNLFDSIANHSNDTLYVFYAVATSATSVTPVFTFGSGTSTGSSLYCVRVAGAEGQNQPYFRQSATRNASNANPNIIMDTAILTGNGCIGIVINATNSAVQFTAPASWTEVAEVSYSSPSVGLEVAVRASGETGSTITWTNANTTAWKGWVWELYVAGTGPSESIASSGIFTL